MQTLRSILLTSTVCLAACQSEKPVTRDSPAAKKAATLAYVFTYDESRVPEGPLGVSIKRGLALLEHTPDSLPQYAGGNLRCTSCHLDKGLRPNAAPLTGVHLRFPKYMDRSGAVIPLEDRVNYCFTRSLAGKAIPQRSKEMIDILSYLAYISRGTPADGHVAGEGMLKMPAMTADSGRGHAIFEANCTRCHGADGAGVAAVPALWGAKSFSVGASMARVERAASFVRHNMPLDKPGTLSDQEAYDVAAYVNSHLRPDSPGKELDWPNGGAPADVPYSTQGRTASTITPVIARKGSAEMIVPAPTSVRK